jgi:hypothetical protein
VARLAARHPVVLARATFQLWLRPWSRLWDESYLAFLDTMVVWARPRRVRVPVLAPCDGFFTVAEARRTAVAYRTRAESYSGMGYDLMLDLGWPQVAAGSMSGSGRSPPSIPAG